MDTRHQDIVEGAGLEESRINTDLADWLKRWGSPILMVVLGLALAYRGWVYIETRKVQALDSAFIELDAASQSRQPVALLQVADEWEGRATVSYQARLEAADQLLLAYTTNIKPGGTSSDPADVPSDEERANFLAQAERLYQGVIDDTRGKSTEALLLMRALSGGAAVAITRGNVKDGSALLSEILPVAQRHGMTGLVEATQARIDRLADGLTPAPLLAQDQIAAYKAQAAPPTSEEGFLSPEELLRELGQEIETAPSIPYESFPAPEEALPALPAPVPSEPTEPAPSQPTSPAPPMSAR